jgi:putative MATE family efflux protein
MSAPTTNILGTGNVKKLLFRLSIPTILAQLINMLYNLVDRIYIGHIEGTGAIQLTALGICTPLILGVSAFAYLVGSGGGPKASIASGEKNDAKAEKILANSAVLLTILGVILTILLLCFNKPMLLAFGGSENTIGYALDYMNIYAVGTLFVELTLGLNCFIAAMGKTTTAMLSVLIGAVLNIALDPLFIFTFGMGVKGAAWATVISQAVSCVWVVAFLFSKRSVWRLRFSLMAPNWAEIGSLLLLGSATFLMQISESILTVSFNSSLHKYGGDVAVGTMTILFSLVQLSFLPLSGLGQGAQPLISYNYGAKNASRVRETFRYLLIVSVSLSMISWAFLMAFPEGLAHIFTSDEELLQHLVTPARIYGASIGLFGIQIACQQTFTAIGDAKSSLAAAIMRKFILLIPLIYILPLIWTANQEYAVYLAEPIADFLAVSFTSVLFYVQSKKALKRIEKSPKKTGEESKEKEML